MNGSASGYQDRSHTQLVEEFIPLVRRLAYHLVARVPPSVEVNDLMQAGLIGLLDALERIPEPAAEPRFEHYASLRIRGAMLDELRMVDTMPRRARAKLRKIQDAMSELEQTQGHPAEDTEIVKALGITLDEYYSVLRDANASQLLYFEDMDDGDGDVLSRLFPGNAQFDAPLTEVTQQRFQNALAEGIEQLPEREKQVLALYYQEDLNLKEIGLVIGVSESRVSQILRQATLRLRSHLANWIDPDNPSSARSAVT